jgi:hypothetical protein
MDFRGYLHLTHGIQMIQEEPIVYGQHGDNLKKSFLIIYSQRLSLLKKYSLRKIRTELGIKYCLEQ